MKRCRWCNLKNELYVKYHDEEWCKLNLDDKDLFKMLILESSQLVDIYVLIVMLMKIKH